MSRSVWYAILSVCVTVISHDSPNSSHQILIKTRCFNIFHLCPGHRSSQNNLSSKKSPSPPITRRLIIRSKYINDVMQTTASANYSSTKEVDTLAPIWSPLFKSPPPTKIPKVTIITVNSTSTFVAITNNTIRETTHPVETTPFTESIKHEPVSSSLDYEKHINPCKYGEPMRNFDQKPLICNPLNPMTCPKGFFCHIGTFRTEAVCCERSGLADPCILPVDEGKGSMHLERYFYDDHSENCHKFIYRGMKGNENSYLTYDECKKRCMRWNIVCETPPKVSEHRSCSVDRRECGDEQWCHFGTSTHTTLCCAGKSTDRCELPVEHGEGNEIITRWFAKRSDGSCDRKCEMFTYKGLKGNQNNFLTKDDCEKQCKPKCEDPCDPGTTPNHSPLFCSATKSCPRKYWCHIGAHTDTTVCCPESGINLCKQPMVEGTGNSSFLRWYFDPTSHKCFKFHYQGKGGNQNSFLTEDDCNNACPVYENPCSVGEPLLMDDKPRRCNPEERCPQTHYCHIGADGKQNFCCRKKSAILTSHTFKVFTKECTSESPRFFWTGWERNNIAVKYPDGNPCDEPMDQGEGHNLLYRYYFDKDSRRCRELTYLGLRGNANNFLNMDDCEATCLVVPNPCAHGRPLMSDQNEPIICGGSEGCPDDYYCHIGSYPETTNCCPGSNTNTCKLPLELGKGIEQLGRWYFDQKEQMCHEFLYRGLHGNANNFISRESCQQNCAGTNPCKQTLSIGYGGEQISRWFYKARSGECLEFTYGGLGGNENNFLSWEDCNNSCRDRKYYCPHGDPLMESSGKALVKCGVNVACPSGFICNMNVEWNTTACCQDPAVVCLQPMDPGRRCEKPEMRYGFDPELDNCVYYEYGGCGGTLNNFETLEECTEICCKND